MATMSEKKTQAFRTCRLKSANVSGKFCFLSDSENGARLHLEFCLFYAAFSSLAEISTLSKLVVYDQ